jgi:hypothetical protein
MRSPAPGCTSNRWPQAALSSSSIRRACFGRSRLRSCRTVHCVTVAGGPGVQLHCVGEKSGADRDCRAKNAG